MSSKFPLISVHSFHIDFWTNFFHNKDLLINFLNRYNLDHTSKYISFFPTSLSINSFNKEKVHLHFLDLINDFLKNKNFTEYKILFKTKNSMQNYINEMNSECKNSYAHLQKNDRFYHIGNNKV